MKVMTCCEWAWPPFCGIKGEPFEKPPFRQGLFVSCPLTIFAFVHLSFFIFVIHVEYTLLFFKKDSNASSAKLF